jgi:hypothetical protein
MRKILQLVVAAGVVAACSVVPSVGASPKASAPGSTFKNHGTSIVDTRTCNQSNGKPAGTISYSGPKTMWPPNHKYATATITTTEEDSGDQMTVTTAGTHNQYDGDTEATGSGHTADDVNPASQTAGPETGPIVQTVQMRSERAGTIQDGRTYTITVDATFTDSDGDGSSEASTSCEQQFTVTVPHDMGQN